jgi:hypothetical protein
VTSANAATYQPTDREKDDFYATPRSAIEQLLQVEKFEGAIWEPACGDGAIVRVLQDAGYRVHASDLVDRGLQEARTGIDFLMEHVAMAPNVVTNPPFTLATDFARKALDLSTGKVAMLLKIGFLEGPTRTDIHQFLAAVWVIRRRVTFLKNGQAFARSNGKGGIHTYAWFVWDKKHFGPPRLGWLEGEPCK